MTPITLTLPYPISANRYWRHRVIVAKGKPPIVSTYVSAEAKAYKAEVAAIVKNRCLQPIHGRVRVRFELYPHRPLDYAKRMRKLGEFWDDTVQCLDTDNAQKVMIDALKDLVFLDDKFVWDTGGKRMEPDAFGARLVVHVESLTVPAAELFGRIEAIEGQTILAAQKTEVIETVFDR